MKRFETKKVTSVETYCVSHTCEFCKKEIGDRIYGKVNEATVLLKTGYAYPDGGSGEELVLDICTDCFKAKLIPWAEANGASFRKEDWDF